MSYLPGLVFSIFPSRKRTFQIDSTSLKTAHKHFKFAPEKRCHALLSVSVCLTSLPTRSSWTKVLGASHRSQQRHRRGLRLRTLLARLQCGPSWAPCRKAHTRPGSSPCRISEKQGSHCCRRRSFFFTASTIDDIVASLQDISITGTHQQRRRNWGAQRLTSRPLENHTATEVDALISINIRFTTQLTRTLLPTLRCHEPSLIMNIGSINLRDWLTLAERPLIHEGVHALIQQGIESGAEGVQSQG